MSVRQAGSQYQAAYDFTAESAAEISVHQGDIVQLIQPEDPNNPGWLYVTSTKTGATGYVPSDFISTVATGSMPSTMPPVSSSSSNVALEQQFSKMNMAAMSTGSMNPLPIGGASTAMGTDSYGVPAAIDYNSQSQRASIAMPPTMMNQQQPFAYPTTTSAYSANGAVYQPPPMNSSMAYGLPATSAATNTPSKGAKLDYWKERDSQFNPPRMPIPAPRRFFYKDIFDDIQGPFAPQEMLERVKTNIISSNSTIVIEVGSGSTNKFEERLLSQLYPDTSKAFTQAPVLLGGEMSWYYMDDAGREQGPFSSQQMKAWFDSGYFSSSLQVRSASGTTKLEPLKSVYYDPQLAFISEPVFQSGVSGGAAPKGTPSGVASPNVGRARAESGRDLLMHALQDGGSTSDVPPAIGGSSAATSSRSKAGGKESSADGEEDFEKVELGAEEPSDKSKKGGKEAEKEIVNIYGKDWKEFKGIPNIVKNPSNYATLLYTFVTRPLHPEVGTLKCHIIRDIDSSHFDYNKYIAYIEDGNVPILAAFRHHHTIHSYYDIKMITNASDDDPSRALTVAQLELNFMGTEFLLHNSVQGHQGSPRDMVCIVYEANRMGSKGPRKMRVGLPSIVDEKCEYYPYEHTGNKNSTIATALKSLLVTNLIPLLNKPPKWNPEKGAYMLNFHGRVTQASVKNFQLVDAIRDPKHDNVILQHGRTGGNKFTMDVKHPMSLLAAFAVCLSSLHSKMGVD